jgi:hypothetical protein
MILQFEATTVTLDDPAQYPYKQSKRLVQVKETSASGVTHVENFLIKDNRYRFVFQDMSTADYEALLGFFLDTVKGMANEFTLTDDLGVAHTVRFTSTKLDFSLTSYGLWAGSFEVEEVGPIA